MCVDSVSAQVAQPAVVPGISEHGPAPPMASPAEKGPFIQGEGHHMAPQPRAVGPTCVADQCGVSQWEDPKGCDISIILTFLQERLDAGNSPSTSKVYVATIAAFRDTLDGHSVGKHPLITSFLRGERRLNPPRLRQMPVWDLLLVLSALFDPPFEPAESSDLKVLSVKTALLLALACGKRVGDLPALSVNSECMQFGPDDCMVRLIPRHGYTPKVLSTPFRAQRAYASLDPERKPRRLSQAPSGIYLHLKLPVDNSPPSVAVPADAFRRIYILFIAVCVFAAATRTLISSKRARSVFFKMPRSSCGSCRAPISDGDHHVICVSCLGEDHAAIALAEGGCPHCELMSMVTLRTSRAFFLQAASSPAGLPRRKKRRAQRVPEPPPSRESSPVRPLASPPASHESLTAGQRPPSAAASAIEDYGEAVRV
ncbi:hypothetical protein PO909_015236 [Leuciscus waleckii]